MGDLKPCREWIDKLNSNLADIVLAESCRKDYE